MIFPATRQRKNPLSIPFDRVATAPPARIRRTGGWARSTGWRYYYDIAKATDAVVIEARVPQGGFGLGGPPVKTKRSSAPSPVAIAPIYRGGGPTNRLLTMVLVGAMNPQYADRIEPFVKILIAHCQKAAKRPAERR